MNVKVGFNKEISISEEDIKEYFPNKKTKIIREDYDMGYIFNIEPTKSKSLNKNELYPIASTMLLDIIINEYSKNLIKKRTNTIWYDLNLKDRKEIIRISQAILLDEENYIMEKEHFKNEIEKYLMETSFILLDGFIRFRLKEFNLFIDIVIDKAIEEFTAEKEYKEFINILQYFVESQEPKYNLINIIFEDNDYKLLDGYGNIVNKDFFNEIVSEIDNGNISKDDLLISSLIVIAPRKLIIHLSEEYKDEDVIKIIRNVFQDRVCFCLGCPQCSEKVDIKTKKQY